MKGWNVEKLALIMKSEREKPNAEFAAKWGQPTPIISKAGHTWGVTNPAADGTWIPHFTMCGVVLGLHDPQFSQRISQAKCLRFCLIPKSCSWFESCSTAKIFVWTYAPLMEALNMPGLLRFPSLPGSGLYTKAGGPEPLFCLHPILNLILNVANKRKKIYSGLGCW